MKFYLNKPIISEREKLSWEKGDKLPKMTLSQYEIIDGTLDDIEQHIIDFIKKSFTDIKEALEINDFEEASIIMPALQMCSVDEIDVIDMNIDVSNTEQDELEWMLKDISNGLTDELEESEELEDDDDDIIEPESIIEPTEDSEELEVINEETENPTEDEISEMEMDIIRKSLLDEEDKTM
jgi:hypothetical protein